MKKPGMDKLSITKAVGMLTPHLKRTTTLLILLSIIGIGLSILHYAATDNMSDVRYLVHLTLRRLYFLLVLVAALLTGQRGAYIVAAGVTSTFLPHMLFHLSGTLEAQSENISDLGLLWIVGLVAGYLSDRLKRSHEDKARLIAINNMSGALGLVLGQMKLDYQASLGLARAMGKQYEGDHGPRFTAQILQKRLEHLGYHLSSLRNIIGAGDLVKKRKNLVKIMAKEVDEIKSENRVSVSIHKQNKIPHLLLDEEKFEFAIKQILKLMVADEHEGQRILIKIAKKNNRAELNIEKLGSSNGAHEESMDHNYTLSLALAIIKMHGGSTEFAKPNGSVTSCRIQLPIIQSN